jgi:hypothetical protein
MLEADRDVAGERRARRDAAVASEPERAGRLLAEHIEHHAELLVSCATYEHVRRQRASDVARARPRPTADRPRS